VAEEVYSCFTTSIVKVPFHEYTEHGTFTSIDFDSISA